MNDTTEVLRPLTEAEVAALKSFAGGNGRTWKSRLNHLWQVGMVVGTEPERLIYCLRNTHGPTWLQKLKLP